ncbi:hypothetical protein B0H15DRAFT_137225 [Mycena belliarum]|uniref:SH3 domain-containing protein n=1 Tax=Mycena belliarum TaxID=1033014 RepID=A0AAD6U967_9AGAR|nr:hypothetical protein B0H15DRAFT_137225 [Mycena belliae]
MLSETSESEESHPKQHSNIAAAVLQNSFYCGTLLMSGVAWLVAFAAQIAVSILVGRTAVGVMWFAIFLQLFLNVGILVTLSRGRVDSFRLQFAFFATMAAVFAVIGVDTSIFADEPSQNAMAAGWLALAVVDILWVLCFGAEPGTPLARLVESMDAAREARRRAVEADTSFYAAEMRSDGSPDETRVGHKKDYLGREARDKDSSSASTSPKQSPEWCGIDRRIVDRSEDLLEEPGLETARDGSNTSSGERPQSSNFGRPPPPASKNRRAVYVDAPQHLSTICDKTESTSASVSWGSQDGSGQPYPFKVCARSDWIPRSPSEISFKKGDILYSAEREGKRWWKVRKADGSVGSAPSNYFKVLSG